MRRPRGATSERDANGHKYCIDCDQWKPLDQFAQNQATVDGFRVHCKSCVAIRRVTNQYNISRKDLLRLLEYQYYKCRICQESLEEGYVVDHNHSCCPGIQSCGKCVRGLLCSNCNRALGFFKDSPTILREAASYLEPRPVFTTGSTRC